MRAALFVAFVLALPATAARTEASTSRTIEVAWPAPVGHFQPRAGAVLTGIPRSPSRADQEALDRALDERLRICRGC